MDPIKWFQDNVFYSPEKKKEINAAQQRSAALSREGPASLGKPLTPAQRAYREKRSSPEAMGVKPASAPAPTGYGGAGAISPTTIKTQTYSNIGATKRGDSEINVVHRGQTAILNGKKVIADGYGNWVESDLSKPMNQRTKIGKYTPGQNRSAVTSEQTPQAVEPETPKEPKTPKTTVAPAETPPVTPPSVEPTGVTTGDLSRTTIAPEGTPVPELTYDRFMEDIGNKLGLEVANPFLSEKYPGFNDDVASLQSNSGFSKGKGEQITRGSSAETVIDGDKPSVTTIDGREVPKATTETAVDGVVSDKLEGDRQLTPGAEGSGHQMNAGSRAFLDYQGPGGILGAMRAAEAARGIVYQGGQHYARDPESETGLRKISKETAADVRWGSSMTDAIAKAKGRTEQTKDTLSVADPATAQNPVTVGADGTAEVIDNQGAMHGAQMGGNSSAFNTGGTDTALNSQEGKQRAQSFLKNKMKL